MALFDEKNNSKSLSKLPEPHIVCKWREEEVLHWLQQVNLSDCVGAFKNREIDGEKLLALNEEKLWLWAGDLKIRQRIQITKYINECRNSNSSDVASIKTAIKSKMRKSPPPVPQPDYTQEDDFCDDGGWDTDFEDEYEDEVEEGDLPVECNHYAEAEEIHSVINRGQENDSQQVCNGRQPISEIVRQLNHRPGLGVQANTTGFQTVENRNTNSTTPPYINGNNRTKPEIPARKPTSGMPRPPTTVDIPKTTAKPRPPSIIARPQQLPPPPPPQTAPKPNFNSVSLTPGRQYSECESPSSDSDNCDNYEIPTSNTSENSFNLVPHKAPSTISLLSGGSSLQDIEGLSPSQSELNRVFMNEEEYEIPDVDSQWSGSSGVSIRSTSSDRPALPPKAVRPSDIHIPPPLPKKPSQRQTEPPSIPAKSFLKKIPDDRTSKSRNKSSLDGCRQVFSGLLNNFGSKMTSEKTSGSTSRVDKFSPERECIPKLIDSFKMTKSSSMSSLRSPYSESSSMVSARPLPPVPGENANDSLIISLRKLSQTSKSDSVGNYLETFPWFQKVERGEAEKLLLTSAQPGSYLVRESRLGGECNPFTLSLLFGGKVSHLNIRRRNDGKFALGKIKDFEKTFQSVDELIKYHQTEPILLTARGLQLGKVSLLYCTEKRP